MLARPTCAICLMVHALSVFIKAISDLNSVLVSRSKLSAVSAEGKSMALIKTHDATSLLNEIRQAIMTETSIFGYMIRTGFYTYATAVERIRLGYRRRYMRRGYDPVSLGEAPKFIDGGFRRTSWSVHRNASDPFRQKLFNRPSDLRRRHSRTISGLEESLKA